MCSYFLNYYSSHLLRVTKQRYFSLNIAIICISCAPQLDLLTLNMNKYAMKLNNKLVFQFNLILGKIEDVLVV